jgi:hypothetical protein
MEVVSTATTTRVNYLDSLAAALVGPRRVKRGLMQEARDHLDDATAAYVRAGYDEPDASARAVADFGSVDEVAPAFQTTLAVASSRRTALLLLAVLSVQPFVWDGPLNSSHGSPGGTFYAVLDVGVEVVGGIMLAAAALLVLASGIGSRWIRDGRVLARVTGLVTIVSAVTLKLTGIAMTVVSYSLLAPQHWLLLLCFLVVPLSVAAASARRTLATA